MNSKLAGTTMSKISLKVALKGAGWLSTFQTVQSARLREKLRQILPSKMPGLEVSGNTNNCQEPKWLT